MRQISICIPTWNRYELTINSFAKVLNDDRIAEVIIVDDASTDGSFEKLLEHLYVFNSGKIKLCRNTHNIDCYANKHESAAKATSEWCIIFDSDNELTPAYLDAIYAIPEWDEKTFYLPEFPKPHFSAVQWSGLVITKENVAQYAHTNLMTNLNAMNFFINRKEYLRVWDGSVDAGSSDSIYFSLCWLKAGNSILVTPNLHYYHHIHADNSNHYNQNSHKYVAFHEQVMNDIKNIK